MRPQALSILLGVVLFVPPVNATSTWHQSGFVIGGYGPTQFADSTLFKLLASAGFDFITPADTLNRQGDATAKGTTARLLLKMQNSSFHLGDLGTVSGGPPPAGAIDTLLAYSTSQGQIYLRDEPDSSLIDDDARAALDVINQSPSTLALINLRGAPPFGDPVTEYPAYIDSFLSQFTTDPAQALSADVYPFEHSQTSDLSAPYYLLTLRTLRDEAARYSTSAYHIPFWFFVQLSRNVDANICNCPYLTMGDIRREAYEALAYGAKGILYWTISPVYTHGAGDYTYGIVNSNGDTASYDGIYPDARFSSIRALNNELHNLGRTLATLEPISIMHVSSKDQVGIDDEVFGASVPHTHIVSGEAYGNDNCMVGYLRGRTEPYGDYLLVVNKDTLDTQSFTLNLETQADSVYKISRDDGSIALVGTNASTISVGSLPPGTGSLFKVVTWSRHMVVADQGAYPAIAVSRTTGRRNVFFSENNGLSAVDMPGASYYIDPPHHLNYAYDSSGVWTSITIDNDDVGERSARTDVSGHPWVAYHYSPASGSQLGGVRCTHWTGSAWVIDTVNTYPSFRAPVGRYPSLAIGYTGLPVVAYWDSIHQQVRCAAKVLGGGWSIDTVATVSSSSDVVPSLAIDATDSPAVAYVGMNGSARILKLASKASGRWSSATVDSGRTWYGWPSLAYDCHGQPHIAYAGVGDNGGAVIWYASLSAGSWSKVIADSVAGEPGLMMKWVRLLLDGHERPRISYSGEVERSGDIEFTPPRVDAYSIVKFPIRPPGSQLLVRLRYAAKDAAWHGEWYDPYPEYEFGDMALDRNGLPSIAYVADAGLTIASRYSWAASADVSAPGTVSSLVGVNCDSNTSEWTVQWTVPYDDSSCSCSGPVAFYDLRTNSSSITSSNWASSDMVSLSYPTYPFATVQAATVSVPTALYCRFVAEDGAGNVSAMSNQIHLFPCLGDGMFAGGGDGGGGFSLKRGPGETHIGVSGETSASALENSLLSGMGNGVPVRDVLGLPRSLDGGSGYQFYVRASAGHRLDVDACRLLVVEHSSGTEAFAEADGALVGTRVLATSARDSLDRDVTGEVNGSGSGFAGYSGTTVIVSTPLDSMESPVVVDAAELEAAPFPIFVETRAADGEWRTVGSIIPRAHAAACIVDSVTPGPFRLEFTGGAQVNSVGRVGVATSGFTTSWAQLGSATTPAGGDEASLIGTADSSSFSLIGPDTLNLQFSVDPTAQGFVRDAFLCVSATPLLVGQTGPTALRRAEATLPVQFALHQNQPNPFRAGTTIRFDLPKGQYVSLDIFDAQGRRVRELVHRFVPAGFQSVQWDERDGSGTVVQPGVFFYRIRMQAFSDRKKMVLVP